MINETFRMLCPSWSPRPQCVCYKAVSPWTWSGPRNHQRPVTAKLDRAGLTKSGRMFELPAIWLSFQLYLA